MDSDNNAIHICIYYPDVFNQNLELNFTQEIIIKKKHGNQ